MYSARHIHSHRPPPVIDAVVLFEVREDLNRQVEEFSARLRRMELDLRASQEEARVLNADSHEAHKKADILEIAKVRLRVGGF